MLKACWRSLELNKVDRMQEKYQMLRVAQHQSTISRSSQNLLIEAFVGKANLDDLTLQKLVFN